MGTCKIFNFALVLKIFHDNEEKYFWKHKYMRVWCPPSKTSAKDFQLILHKHYHQSVLFQSTHKSCIFILNFESYENLNISCPARLLLKNSITPSAYQGLHRSMKLFHCRFLMVPILTNIKLKKSERWNFLVGHGPKNILISKIQLCMYFEFKKIILV